MQASCVRTTTGLFFFGLFALATLATHPAARADEVIADSIHLLDYVPPVLIFNQTSGGGNPATIWNLYGGELLNPSSQHTLGFAGSLMIRPGTVTILSNGIGFNRSPQVLFHVNKDSTLSGEVVTWMAVSDDLTSRLQIDNVNATPGVFVPRIQGKSGSANAALILEGKIDIDTGSNPVIVHNTAVISGGGVSTRPLVAYRNNGVNKVTVSATGVVTATSFQPASSRTFKRDIVELESRAAGQAFRAMTPVRYVYNDDPQATAHVGFIAEDVPELVASSDRQSVPIMDVVALMTRIVKDNQAVIDAQQKTIEASQVAIESHLGEIVQKAVSVKRRAEMLETERALHVQNQKLVDDLKKRLEALEASACRRSTP